MTTPTVTVPVDDWKHILGALKNAQARLRPGAAACNVASVLAKIERLSSTPAMPTGAIDAKAVAAILNPALFSHDKIVAHRAASPIAVTIARRDAVAAVRKVLDAASLSYVSAAPAPEGVWIEYRRLLEAKIEQWTDSNYLGDDRLEVDDALDLADAIKAVLSALANREEVPAEWFGVTGAVDETEALAVALFAARCPGVRMTDEDLHHYRSAAQRAMQVVSAELSGNSGQLEAPAEAGEGVNWKAEYEAVCGQTIQDREAIAKIIDPEAFVPMEDVIGMRKALVKADAILALRAQPPAREDAQPVARVDSTEPESIMWLAQSAQLSDGTNLYTHPAPDALRVAVSDAMVEAACSRFVSESDDIWSASVWPEGPDDDGERGDGGRVRLISEADQHNIRAAMRFAMTDALAALQAEQKGGA